MDVLSVIRKHGWTAKAVAENMTSMRGNAVSRGNFSNTVNHGNPKVSYLRQIAEIIGANISEFFEDELPPKEEQAPTTPTTYEHTIVLDGVEYGLVPL